MDSEKLIDESQHGFTKGKLCLADLVTLYRGVTVDKGRANDIKSIWTCADIWHSPAQLERHGFD